MPCVSSTFPALASLGLPSPGGPDPLPSGCTFHVDSNTTYLGQGVVAGGSPFRLRQLSDQGALAFESWAAGGPLEAALSQQQLARRLVDDGVLHPTWPSEVFLAFDDVTVVIPVRDRPEQLNDLLAQLEEFRVIVVDDCSEDVNEIRRITSLHNVRLVTRDRQGGPGAARNTGMHEVTTPLTVFIDSDCWLTPEWLPPLLAHFTDPRVGAVAPRIQGSRGASSRERFEHDASPLDVGSSPSLVRPGSPVSFLPSATLLLRTRLGPMLFDESLNGGEDVDLVWRLAESGWLVRFEPSSVVHHPMRGTLHGWFAQRYFYGTTAAPLEQRHGDAAAPLKGPFWNLLGWLFVALGLPGLGAVCLGVSVELLRKRLQSFSDSPLRLAWDLSRFSWQHTPALCRQLVRTYAPLMILGSLFSRRLRRALLVTLSVGTLDRWQKSGSDLDVASFSYWSVLDDVTYAAGVWSGVLKMKRPGALLPRVTFTWRKPVPPFQNSSSQHT